MCCARGAGSSAGEEALESLGDRGGQATGPAGSLFDAPERFLQASR